MRHLTLDRIQITKSVAQNLARRAGVNWSDYLAHGSALLSDNVKILTHGFASGGGGGPATRHHLLITGSLAGGQYRDLLGALPGHLHPMLPSACEPAEEPQLDREAQLAARLRRQWLRDTERDTRATSA
jgi:hypothetical protein